MTIDNVYSKNQLKEFIEDFNTISIKDKYFTIIKIMSEYYGLEINGIHIENITFDENILRIITPNNRKIELRIMDDLEIKIGKE